MDYVQHTAAAANSCGKYNNTVSFILLYLFSVNETFITKLLLDFMGIQALVALA